MRVVLAGGAGTLGRRVADHLASHGHDVVVLTRRRRTDLAHRQVEWDGLTSGAWMSELDGAVVVNLAGELVDRRPTARNIDLLRRSRVEPTRALVDASQRCGCAPPVWLQMSTLAIYGDAGQRTVVEGEPPANGPPQMAGVASAWERAVAGARADRLVILRTGLVIDVGAPVFERLSRLTRFGLGGRMGSGRQWVSWIHIDDFVRAVRHLVDAAALDGVVHVTSPNPIPSGDMMASFRAALRRRWAPPAPAPVVRLGAFLMGSDPALALTGRRCMPDRLVASGFEFRHPQFESALADLLRRDAS